MNSCKKTMNLLFYTVRHITIHQAYPLQHWQLPVETQNLASHEQPIAHTRI